METPIILLDACVLYPAPLRDLLMHLALADLFQAKWSEDIHREWMRSVRENRKDISMKQLERVRSLMDAHIRDCLVEGYEELVDSLTLPDKDDRHVLAAAIKANADAIVTFNLKDFPAALLRDHQITARHPDEFVVSLLRSQPGAVCSAIKKQRENLKHPPKTVQEFLATLQQCQLPETAEQLRQFEDLL